VFQPFDSMIHNRLAGMSINNLYEEMTIPWNRKDNEEKAKEEYKLFLDSTKRLIEKWVNLNNLFPFLRISS